MNAAFKSATQWMRPAAPLLTHQQTVTRLYRASLKCMMSWAIQRDIINEEAFNIRQRFEANRDVAPDSPQMNAILRESQTELTEATHPDRYVLCWMPGGSKFMRNPPPPLDVCFPHGVPADLAEAITEVNINQIEVTQQTPPSSVLVDFSLKEQVPDMPHGWEPQILPITGMSRPEDETNHI